jgi:hypothetical protein
LSVLICCVAVVQLRQQIIDVHVSATSRLNAVPFFSVAASPAAVFLFASPQLGSKFFSRSHDAVIRIYDVAGNMLETHEHAGEFKEP